MKDRKNQERGLERVSHFFLSAPETAKEKERVTIQVAAKALGVSKGTIITYLNKGLLTRIKEDGGIYIEMDEVRSLGEGKKGAAGFLEMEQSKQALTHSKQFGKKPHDLPAASGEAKGKELARLRSELYNLKQNLEAQTSELAETRSKLRELEKEQKKRLFSFAKATDVSDHNGKDTQNRLLAVEEEIKGLQRPWGSGKKKLVALGILSLLGGLILSVWWPNRPPTQLPSPVTEKPVFGSGTVQATSQPYSPSVETPASSEKSVSLWLEEEQQDFGLASTPAAYVLRAETLARTWLHLIIDDSQELEYLLNPNEKHTWGAMSGFKLHVGNAAGLKLYLNDQPLKALGESGEVVLLELPDPSLIATSSNSEYESRSQ